MKYAWLLLLAGVVVLGVSGCAHHGMYGRGHGAYMMGSCANAPGTCAPCGGAACGCAAGRGPCVVGRAPMQAMAYPYYTTRGPRDFLVSDPKPIGP